MNFNILDLFSGAGGFSLGLEMLPNFKTVLATDISKSALETIKHNNPSIHTILGDILNKKTKQEIVDKAKELDVNMIIGGPPCQGFSNKGKKLGLKDPRNFLFLEYLHIVKLIQPEIFIIENVKTMLSSADGYFKDEIKSHIEDLGYFMDYKILNSYNFGVPQTRERAFILASKNKFISLPKNHQTKPFVNVEDAISDLSYLKSGEGQDVSDYLFNPRTDYQKACRCGSKKLYNHIATNHSEETLYKLSLIPPEKGKEYLPKKYHGNQRFKTTWSRLEWDKPSPTIDTRFDTPSNGKNTHPELNRAITPREAARIQSFPDYYRFLGTKTEICTQIGNAVPPLLSKGIGKVIIEQFKDNYIKTSDYLIYNDDAYKIIHEFKKNNIIVDHIITDPPYNISKENNFNTMKNPRLGVDFGDWDKNFNLFSWIKEYSKILDKNGSMIVFCSYLYMSYIIDVMEDSGLIVKDILKWVKTNPMPRNINRRYVQDTEFAIWAVKKNAKWVFNKPDSVPYLRPQFESSVVSGKEKLGHPTQKSLKVMNEIIKIHTNKNQIILDPFMGSGTTGEAALRNNRKFIGIELAKEYFKISKNRINSLKK